MSKFPVEISKDYFNVSNVACNKCTEVQSCLHGPQDVPNAFFRRVCKIAKKLTIIVVKSVCLSFCLTLWKNWRAFVTFNIYGLFENLSGKNLTSIKGYVMTHVNLL